MGMRYHKSVKICKGVRVNFSASGPSLSLGGRGHTVNIGPHGTRRTIGIPGTGLSYSQRVGGITSANRTQTAHSAAPMPANVQVSMSDNGQVTLLDGDGNVITDPSLIRRIKTMAQYKEVAAQLENQRLDRIDELVQNSEDENDCMINICRLSAFVNSRETFQQMLDGMELEEYEEQPFEQAEPTEESVRAELEDEAEINVTAYFFRGSKIKQYVEEHMAERFTVEHDGWEAARKAWELQQQNEKEAFDAVALEEFKHKQVLLSALIDGDSSAISEIFDAWIASCELPVEININYDWQEETGTMLLDVDLPEIEDLPSTRMMKTDTGKLKEKKKTQTELRGEYAACVFGLAVFIASNAFNVSPAIERILISGYTQRRDKEGNLVDDYIYSLKFPRHMFEEKELTAMDPQVFCLYAVNRCNMTTTGLFKTITPYEAYDL